MIDKLNQVKKTEKTPVFKAAQKGIIPRKEWSGKKSPHMKLKMKRKHVETKIKISISLSRTKIQVKFGQRTVLASTNQFDKGQNIRELLYVKTEDKDLKGKKQHQEVFLFYFEFSKALIFH